jgi:hypothetical protein
MLARILIAVLIVVTGIAAIALHHRMLPRPGVVALIGCQIAAPAIVFAGIAVIEKGFGLVEPLRTLWFLTTVVFWPASLVAAVVMIWRSPGRPARSSAPGSAAARSERYWPGLGQHHRRSFEQISSNAIAAFELRRPAARLPTRAWLSAALTAAGFAATSSPIPHRSGYPKKLAALITNTRRYDRLIARA